jgi:hypothetical protein
MGSWEGVATQSRDKGKIQVEDILQPLDGRRGLVCQDLDEIRSGFVAGGLEGIFVELLDAVANLVINLGAGECTVDARSGLGRVATKEIWRRRSAKWLQ